MKTVLKDSAIQFIFFRSSSSKQECSWVISAPEDKLVRISLSTLTLIQPGDYLVARDGTNVSAVVLHNFTTASPRDVWWTSSGQSLSVQFSTDKLTNNHEFKLYYRYTRNIEGTFQCLIMETILNFVEYLCHFS